ncbi:MAG: hypothetical protein ACQETE_05715 [Bacteroidota bacterium]
MLPTLLFAQQRAPNPEDLPSKEPVIRPSSNQGYKLVINTGGSFAFEIPEAWDATHNGAKTDGYYIVPNNIASSDSVVIAIARAPSVGNKKGFLRMLQYQYGDYEPFTFHDESQGYHFEQPGKRSEVYARLGSKMRLLLTIDAPSEWRKQNREKLIYLAKSIRIQSFNLQR